MDAHRGPPGQTPALPESRRTRQQTARAARPAPPPLCLESFRPGMRVAIAVSGGADSVALLRSLIHANGAGKSGPGLVLSVAHMQHGIRGVEADADAAFVQALAAELDLPFHRKDVDTPAKAGRDHIGLEEAARTLRYSWFAELLGSGAADTVATGHTLNDQAETVLHKLLRGAWTEGLAGIHPVLKLGGNQILRPLLGATRERIVAWLTSIGQDWREDASNADLHYTRNRIRHQLLPQMETFNPRIAQQMAQMAAIAREEDAYWQQETGRLLPGLLLPGRAVRGGGRSSSTVPGERTQAIEVERLRGLHPALLRRLLRGAAKELGVSLDFEETARLLALVDAGPGLRREELTGNLRAERTPRELRLVYSAKPMGPEPAATPEMVAIDVPGEQEAFGWRVRCALAEGASGGAGPATLRLALPGDRVQLRYTRGAPKRVKEVLERMGIPAADRMAWPVLVWQGEIVWMSGALLEPTPVSQGLRVEAEKLL